MIQLYLEKVELIVDAIFCHLSKREQSKFKNKFMRSNDSKREEMSEDYGGVAYCTYFCYKQSGNK